MGARPAPPESGSDLNSIFVLRVGHWQHAPRSTAAAPIPLHSQFTGVEVLLVVSQPLSKSRFLTVQEVADLMRVSTMTVYRIIKAGDLAAVRVGRSFRVRESDVDAYLGARYSQ